MSKMSQIAMIMDEKAAELGYESVEAMEADGWKVDYELKDDTLEVTCTKKNTGGEKLGDLLKSILPDEEEKDEEEKAHDFELSRRDRYVKELYAIADDLCGWAVVLKDIANYIKEEIK